MASGITIIVSVAGLLAAGIAILVTNNSVQKNIMLSETAENISLKSGELNYISVNFLLYRDASQVKKWHSAYSALEYLINGLEVELPEEKMIVSGIGRNAARLRTVFEDSVSAAGAPFSRDRFSLYWNRLAVQSQNLISDANLLSRLLWAKADRLSAARNTLGYIFSFFLAAFILLTYFFNYRYIAAALKEFRDGAARIGGGELDYRIPVKRNDEIGEAVVSFNKMAGMRQKAERELKEKTEALIASERALERSRHLTMLGELSATVAHELRNPLAAIELAVFNLSKKCVPGSDKHLATIDLKINESSQIINNLLYFTRIKDAQYKDVRIDELLGETVSAFRGQFRIKEGVVEADYSGLYGFVIKADAVQIGEVLHNILINAYDAVSKKEGAKIKITGALNGNEVRIQIDDNGGGIEREDLPRVFVPFFTRKSKGTGLGLPIAKQIIENHNGGICVESQTGAGTSVIITLPANPAAAL